MSKLIFTPEMFESDEEWSKFFNNGKIMAARLAQKTFDQWLSEQKRVYLYEHHSSQQKWYFDSVVDASQGATHTAILCCVEPIEKKCAHDSLLRDYSAANIKYICSKCNANLTSFGFEGE